MNGGSDENDARDGRLIAFGGGRTSGPINVAAALNGHPGGGRMDFETETFICFDEAQITSAANRSQPKPSDPCHTLAARARPATIVYLTNGRLVDGVANTIDASLNKHNRGQAILQHEVTHTLKGVGFDGSEDGSGRGTPIVPVEPDIAFNPQAAGKQTSLGVNQHSTGAVNGSQVAGVAGVAGVRRLLPVECERLQGFPDNWTAFGHDGKPIADGPRYAMMGNAVSAPVAEWIARRIRCAITP
jgi:DNA (cytosine-5)-methyltransferase 1